MRKEFATRWLRPNYGILLLAILGVGGWAVWSRIASHSDLWPEKKENTHPTDHTLTRPRAEGENVYTGEIERIEALEQSLRASVDEQVKSGRAGTIGIYFHSLNDGRWAGINEDVPFSPESLLKVPLMMAYYKTAEEQPRILFDRIRCEGSHQSNAYLFFRSSRSLQAGEVYTVNDLLYRMIVYSDLDAHSHLYKHIDKKLLYDLYQDFGVSEPENITGISGRISARTYASFLTALYDAFYLNTEFSERALELLTEVQFHSGLVAGVPVGTRVAHKFGERSVLLPGGAALARSLHDCGIIYHPKGAYVLCVMTEGTDFRQLGTAITDISRLVYTEMIKDQDSR